MKKEASTALVLFCALTAAFPAPAVSQDYESMLHGFLGRGKIDNHTQDIVQTNINTRQGQIEQEIAAGVASGQLTPAEESELRMQLTGVANMQGQYLAMGGGKLNNIQIQSLLNELSAVTTKLQAYLTNATTVTTAPSPRQHSRWFQQPESQGYTWNHMSEGHVDSYQAEILASIQSALTSGKISVSTAQSLRGQLNQTDVNQARMSADGHLSRSEGQELMAQLDAVKSKLAVEIANGQRYSHGGGHHYGWGHGWGQGSTPGQSMLRQRIYDGMRSGKLSRAEADRLLGSEQRIASLEARMQSSGGRLTYAEQKILLSERDRLNASINQELTDHNAW